MQTASPTGSLTLQRCKLTRVSDLLREFSFLANDIIVQVEAGQLTIWNIPIFLELSYASLRNASLMGLSSLADSNFNYYTWMEIEKQDFSLREGLK